MPVDISLLPYFLNQTTHNRKVVPIHSDTSFGDGFRALRKRVERAMDGLKEYDPTPSECEPEDGA